MAAATLRQVRAERGIGINNMVVNSPDGTLGGAPVDGADLNKYLERLHEVIDFSRAAGIDKSITRSGNMPSNLSRREMRANLEKALSDAAAVAQRENYTLFLEVLNSLADHPGYYLDSWSEGAEMVRAIDNPNLKLLYDVYHMQIMHGNVIATIEKDIDIIGHFHAANVPGRGELMNGELNYPDIISRIAASGYTGAFGLEYMPALADHSKSLSETRAFLSEYD